MELQVSDHPLDKLREIFHQPSLTSR
jgi:hypothetical protein